MREVRHVGQRAGEGGMNWHPDSTYCFADNPIAPCLERAAQEQSGRRLALRLMQAAFPAQRDLFNCRSESRRERILRDEMAALQQEIAAVDAEISMAVDEGRS